jgi:hypothetical protein
MKYKIVYKDAYFDLIKKIENAISQYKCIRKEILYLENLFERPMITHDLIRNDYCEKILQEILKGEDKWIK